MAIPGSPIMPENEGEHRDTKLTAERRPLPSYEAPSRTPFGQNKNGRSLPYNTPMVATPATAAMTPDDDVECSRRNNISPMPTVYITMSNDCESTAEASGSRSPSVRSEDTSPGRTLFLEEDNTTTNNHWNKNKVLRSRRRRSDDEPSPNNERRSRSMGSDQYNHFLDQPVSAVRNSPLNSGEHDDEYCGAGGAPSSYEHHPPEPMIPMRDTSSSSYTMHRRRLSQSQHTGTQVSWKQTILTTKCLVWLLCLVGLTSISMIVIFNHQMGASEMSQMEHRDHVAVLFRRASSPGGVAVPDLQLRGKPSNPGGGTPDLSASRDTSNNNKRRPVNLNNLAKLKHDKVKDDVQKDKKKTSKDIDEHHHHEKKPKDDHHHHHHHHDDHKHTKDTDVHKQDKDKKKKKKKAEEIPRVYKRVSPNFITFDNIPAVTLPDEQLDDESSETINVLETDRLLYSEPLGDNSNHRVIILDGSSPEHWEPRQKRQIELYPADFTDNTQFYGIRDSSDEEVVSTMEMREPYVKGECVPMQEWQTTFHPSCNGMHELDMEGMGDERNEDDWKLFGMKGFWRNAWRFDSIGGHSDLQDRDTIVLKTLKINHRFEDAYFENHRIDAVVLERLTASPHVINVFGFCGHSVLTEYADGKRLGELADKKAKEPMARLAIARDIAQGLADVHGIDGDGNATFVHMDINPANVVSIGGTLKLNDFNIGILRRWNTTSNEPCGIPAQYPNPQWRSPEEAREEQNLTEKIDVFSLGHILFRLICGHEPWHKFEPGGMPPKDVMNEKVKQGILPTIPEEVMKSTDPEIAAIREAMLRCYTYDPKDRPSAREIANSLQSALMKMEKKIA